MLITVINYFSLPLHTSKFIKQDHLFKNEGLDYITNELDSLSRFCC